jgi:hypothetical protein
MGECILLIIHNDSCHPTEHKNSAIQYMINRTNTYPISTNNKHHKLQRINIILQNNNYPQFTHKNNRRKQNKNTTTSTTQKKKWATFTYIGKQTRTITKLFKDTHIKIAYKTKNTIQNHLRYKKQKQDNTVVPRYTIALIYDCFEIRSAERALFCFEM